MKSNIGYSKSAGIGSLPPAEEVEPIYDELPYEEPIAADHESGKKKDHEYVNDPQGGAYKEATDEAVMRERDDDGYYVNDDLFPEEYQNAERNTTAAMTMDNEEAIDETVMRERDDDGYYVNDDLFPDEYQDAERNTTAATCMTMDNSGDDDRSK